MYTYTQFIRFFSTGFLLCGRREYIHTYILLSYIYIYIYISIYKTVNNNIENAWVYIQ
jgi:hypothetical protein